MENANHKVAMAMHEGVDVKEEGVGDVGLALRLKAQHDQ